MKKWSAPSIAGSAWPSSSSEDEADAVSSRLEGAGETVFRIGRVEAGQRGCTVTRRMARLVRNPSCVTRKRVAILISGRGSNMRELVEQANGYEVVLVASNKPRAAGLDWARGGGLPTWTGTARRRQGSAGSRAVSAVLDDHRIGTVALAGFMRILSPWFIGQWRGPDRQHPPVAAAQISRPRYPPAGDRGRRQDERLFGPLVTEDLDAGEVLGSAEVPIEPGDTPDTLEQRVLAAEHLLYPRILSQFVQR